MRAWTYTTVPTTLESALTLTSNAPLPPLPLSPGTYLIRVHSASLNPVDYKLPELPLVGRLAIPKPATPGLDFSGTIVLSTPTSRLQPGTRVFGKLEPKQQFGTLAEYIVGSSEGTVEVPEGVGMEEASALGVCGLVTYQALTRNVREGMRVLVNGGSGGTGTFAVQIAKALGAEVVVTCSGESAGGFRFVRKAVVVGVYATWEGVYANRQNRRERPPLQSPRRQPSNRLPHHQRPSPPIPNPPEIRLHPRQRRRPHLPLLDRPSLHHSRSEIPPNRLAGQPSLPLRPRLPLRSPHVAGWRPEKVCFCVCVDGL